MHKIGQIVSKKEKEIFDIFFNIKINLNSWYNNDAGIDFFLNVDKIIYFFKYSFIGSINLII